MKLRQYRCTRNSPNPKAPIAERQGHYVIARSEEEALLEMQRRFPNDTLGFTILTWS